MIVISDTTPIISLMKVGQLDLLQRLFGTVCIPRAVYRELTENEMYKDEAAIVSICSYLLVEEVESEIRISDSLYNLVAEHISKGN